MTCCNWQTLPTKRTCYLCATATYLVTVTCNQLSVGTLTTVKGYTRLKTTLAFDRSHIKKSDNMNTTSRWHDALGKRGDVIVCPQYVQGQSPKKTMYWKLNADIKRNVAITNRSCIQFIGSFSVLADYFQWHFSERPHMRSFVNTSFTIWKIYYHWISARCCLWLQ